MVTSLQMQNLAHDGISEALSLSIPLQQVVEPRATHYLGCAAAIVATGA